MNSKRASGSNFGLWRMFLVFITSLVAASIVYLLMSEVISANSLVRYTPNRNISSAPAPNRDVYRDGVSQSVVSAKPSEPEPAKPYPVVRRKNLLGRSWHPGMFEDVDMEAYKHMPVYNDTSTRPLDMGLTSINTTVRLISPRGRSIQVGDLLQYRIQARDINGRNRIVGGDFWFASLSSRKNPKASTVGYIIDYGNGTYDAFVLAAWSGSATFNLVLVHPYEAIYYLRNSIWNKEGRMFFFGHYYFNRKKAVGSCTIRRLSEWRGQCDYPTYQAGGSTVFTCDYQPGFPCSSLVSFSTDKLKIGKAIQKMVEGVEYLFKSPNFMQGIPVPNGSLIVQGSEFTHPDLPPCKADQPIPAIQGFFKDGKWTSLLCQYSDWTSKPSITSCLRGKSVVLLGDSTTRQLFGAILSALNTEGNYQGTPFVKKITYPSLDNLTVFWQFHPYILGSGKTRLDQVRDEVDVLNSLNDSDCNYIVSIGLWAHFSPWTRDSYIERVRLIRRALLEFRKRCPNAPVVIKGPHDRGPTNLGGAVLGSAYIIKQLEEINREAFEGTGAFFMPVWDINFAYPSKNTVHMPKGAVREGLKLLLGYVCETLSKQGNY